MKTGRKIDWKRIHDITIDEVKKAKGLENLSDVEAQEVIDIIKIYCQCIYSIYERSKKGEIYLDAIILDLNKNQLHKRAA
ncbi:MAG TPA: hypothetical protein VLB84_17725 [Bacteroidia bacterium]|nr:hypothetical protein [Bacteroidia bacterium]